MRRYVAAVVVLAVLAIAPTGCSRAANVPTLSTKTTASRPTATGTADGLAVVLSLARRSYSANSTAAALVEATNSTESTVTTVALFRIAIDDLSTGERVFDTNRLRYGLVPVSVGPGKVYRTDQVFVVPAAGSYVLSLPEVLDSRRHPVALPFESVESSSGG